MGKFSGMLLCSDIDGTLINDEHKVSLKNQLAIEYFKNEGGIFTLATGRVPSGMRMFLDKVKPNAPVISHNGSAIYDFKKNEFVWQLGLDDDVTEVVNYVTENIPFAGVEIVIGDTVHFCKMNDTVEEHRILEHFPLNDSNYKNLPKQWTKILFIQTPEELPIVKDFLLKSHFVGKYKFVQSSPKYFEVINLQSSKGRAMQELAKRLGIPMSMTIGIGDNENDLEMVQDAAIGVAVGNAMPRVKEAANHITVTNNFDAIARIIADLDCGKLSMKKIS